MGRGLGRAICGKREEITLVWLIAFLMHALRKLLPALQTTFKHETAMFRAEPALAEFLERSCFSLLQEDSKITLSRAVSGYEVQVTFPALAFPEGEEAMAVPFEVTVQREQAALLFHCSRHKDVLRVEGLKHSQQDYEGPDFATLDPVLRQLWLEFLHTLGVDDALAEFVEAYALEAEQKLYLRWLQEAKTVVGSQSDK